MTKRVKAHLPLLKRLCKCSPKEKGTLLKIAGKPLQLCLQECAINILNGNVPLSKGQFTRLRKYKTPLRELSKKKTSQTKRLAIEQKGGFLPTLLAPILGAVMGGVLK